ncbi:putative malate dehydrogenase 1B [Aplochiton taeniatus]
MAKFVLAGKADCPYFAKAELLADLLVRNLPDFSIHKISILPEEWEEWLDSTCKANGWTHQHSPLIWRELVDRGGKGMILGGFSDFLEHVQGYYGIVSDMPTELMLNIAQENLRTRKIISEENRHRRSTIKPMHIWMSGALHQTCYSLIPMLFTAGVFSDVPTISLHLLDLEGSEEELLGLQMETEDLALPQIHKVTVHTDLGKAFEQAQVILLLDDSWSDDEQHSVNTEGVEEEARQRAFRLKMVAERYHAYGRLINARALKDVRVVVAGDSFVSLKCCLLLEGAPSIPSHHFVAMATQLEYEARAHVAQKLSVKTADISDVILWGNMSGCYHIDLQRAKVFRYKGAIWGRKDFSQPVLPMIYDKKWVESDFLDFVKSQRTTISCKTHRVASISATNGIITILKALNGHSSLGQILSLGVLSTGQFNIPAGIVFSMPVSFNNGKWSVWTDVTIGDELRAKLQMAIVQLQEVSDYWTQ